MTCLCFSPAWPSSDNCYLPYQPNTHTPVSPILAYGCRLLCPSSHSALQSPYMYQMHAIQNLAALYASSPDFKWNLYHSLSLWRCFVFPYLTYLRAKRQEQVSCLPVVLKSQSSALYLTHTHTHTHTHMHTPTPAPRHLVAMFGKRCCTCCALNSCSVSICEAVASVVLGPAA